LGYGTTFFWHGILASSHDRFAYGSICLGFAEVHFTFFFVHFFLTTQ
jgi:hypothetical protein